MNNQKTGHKAEYETAQVENTIVRLPNGRELVDFNTDVVIELRKAGILASVEYPGYISCPGGLSFGTANGTWGWSDEFGNGGESAISGQTLDVAAVVDFIKNLPVSGPVESPLQGVCKDCGNGTLNNELNPAFDVEPDIYGDYTVLVCNRCGSTHLDVVVL